jgi:hypothetical protein
LQPESSLCLTALPFRNQKIMHSILLLIEKDVDTIGAHRLHELFTFSLEGFAFAN